MRKALSVKRRKGQSGLNEEVDRPFIKRGKSTPIPINTILQSALKKFGLDDKIAKYNFVTKWPEIVGGEIAKRTKPEMIRGKKLVIRVCDSTWAQELSFHKQAIVTRLKRHLDNPDLIEDLVFMVGEIRK